jgi:disulfide oxidoreductase YuzD
MIITGSEPLDTFLKFCGIIGIIATAAKGIVYFLTPYRETKKKIDEHEKRLNDHDTYLKNDKEKLESLTKLSKDSLRLQLAVVNHAIDGNGIERLRQVREDIQDELFETKEI